MYIPKRDMKPVAIFICDEWKRPSSFKFVGVFIRAYKIKELLRRLKRESVVDIDQQFINHLSKLDVEDANSSIENLFFKEIEFNESYI